MAGATGNDRAAVPAGVLFLSVALVFWGTSFRAVVVAGEHTSPLVLGTLRVVPAALILLIVLPFVGARLPSRSTLFWALVTGALMVALPFEVSTEATVRIGPGNAAVLANTAPFFVLVLGRLFLQERTSWLGVSGLFLGFAGVVVMVSSQLGGAADAGDLVLGMAMAVSTSAGWGVGTLLVKRLVDRDPDTDLLVLTAGQFVVAAAILLPIALGLRGIGGTDWSSPEFLASTAWLAIGSSAIGTLAYFGALRKMSATRAAAWGFLTPAVAVVVEVARGNAPEPIVLLGMVVAIAGVALVNVAPQRVAEPSPSLASRSR